MNYCRRGSRCSAVKGLDPALRSQDDEDGESIHDSSVPSCCVWALSVPAVQAFVIGYYDAFATGPG